LRPLNHSGHPLALHTLRLLFEFQDQVPVVRALDVANTRGEGWKLSLNVLCVLFEVLMAVDLLTPVFQDIMIVEL
jgi:hypothetical protein